MPAPPEPEPTHASWLNIALHFVLGAALGYVLAVLFIEGRGWHGHRGRWYRIPIVDPAHGSLFMFGLVIFLGGLFAWKGDDLWSKDAFKSTSRLALQHTQESLRWVRRVTWFGGAIAAYALVRSWI